MNFLLKNLELHLPEHCLLNGEKSYDQGNVLNLYESEKHLWVSYVLEHEVEIQISPSKVLAYSCECEDYKDKDVCEHIGATLLALRKHLSINKEKKQKRKISKTPPKRLTINAVFEHVDNEDLVSFMRQYAKANRTFGLALKARFAAKVPMENSYEKYAQLIDSTINSYRKKDDKINFTGSIQIIGIAKQLLGLAKDEIALENLSEGFVILKCLIKKITPVLQKLENNQEKISLFIDASFKTIKQLLSFEPAPYLQNQIRLFCLEEMTKPIYYLNEFSFYFIDLLKLISIEQKELKELLKVIDYQLDSQEISENFRAKLIFEKMKLLDKLGSKHQIHLLINKHLQNPELILAVIENSINTKDYTQAKDIAIKGLSQKYKELYKVKIEILLLQIYLTLNEKEKIAPLSKELFIETFDFKYLNIYKSYSTKQWNESIKELLTKLHNLPYSIKKRDTIAKFLTEEKLHDELFEYMTRLGSLDLLRNFDKFLLPEKKKEVFELYHQLLSQYLNHHFGRIPSEKIKNTILHLFEIGANDLASMLVKQIKSDFKERPSLMDELNLF
jgi:hypothetical protein